MTAELPCATPLLRRIRRGRGTCVGVTPSGRRARQGLPVALFFKEPAVASVELPEIELVGFDVGHGFVVGYGMDLDGRYRNLPDIWLIE